MFRRKDPFTKVEREMFEVAKTRFEKLPVPEIIDWLDQAGSGIARALDDVRRLRMPESVGEARLGVVALMAGIETLDERLSPSDKR